MKKIDLIHKLRQLQGISDDERAYLINLVNTKKKYGLVWEDKPEDVEEQLRENLPVLKEVKNRAIMNGEGFPNHLLIEGDNLHALTALTFTHEGKVDVIYIDPPYNTGNKSWRYNNDYVEKDDNYKHSKFVSFLYKRVKIAKRLLKDSGIICCAIDDYEQHNVRHIFDEVFGEENRLGSVTVVHNPGGRQDERFFPTAHEYMFVYAKNQAVAEIGRLELSEKKLKQFAQKDDLGNYKLRGFRRSGANSRRIDRPKLWYPIYLNPLSLDLDISIKPGYTIKLEPIDDDGVERVWRWNPTTFMEKKSKYVEVKTIRGNYSIQVKERENDNEGEKPKTIWVDPKYSAVNGTAELKNIFSDRKEKIFDFPKSPFLLFDVLKICSLGSNDVILDFFGGSGTTLQALMTLNNEDGGVRQGIMVTNNENNICEEVTYERNKRVIQGFSNSKGDRIAGLINNNLRYYRCEFVGREPSIKNKKEVTRLATDLLCIKEDIYTEQRKIGDYQLNATYVRCFQQDKIYLLVIYDEDVVEQIVEVIQSVVEADTERNTQFKVYVFSNGQYPYTEEFEEVLPYITLCALPDAIYKAYQNVLPKRQRQQVPELEESTAEEVETSLQYETNPNLFNQAG
jgi:adenine-specific DNA-methyltransferase